MTTKGQGKKQISFEQQKKIRSSLKPELSYLHMLCSGLKMGFDQNEYFLQLDKMKNVKLLETMLKVMPNIVPQVKLFKRKIIATTDIL